MKQKSDNHTRAERFGLVAMAREDERFERSASVRRQGNPYRAQRRAREMARSEARRSSS
jgi:hypothetical protein